jgi:hypothetical protein
MSPDDALKRQIECYRRMTPEQRLGLAFELSEFSCEFARVGIRSQHPGITPEEVERELRRRLELARS